ncbi:HipA domain-containing protein [Verrucomicrobiota bacterium]
MKYRCHSTLVDIDREGFSSVGLKLLTGGNRKFPHCLQFKREDITSVQVEAAEHMSISGVQDKISLKLVRGTLASAERDGQYILKPVPSLIVPEFMRDVPANEHLTMQIASQVFNISTAANACVFLKDKSMAYITKRFDYRGNTKLSQEDFCQLSSRSPESHGKNYKYDGSYEEVGRILQKFCKAHIVEIEKLYKLITFNYVFSNGDAHLKNFSLYQTPYDDYVLTPAYDLICSSMHFPNESRTALDLFDNYESPSYQRNGYYGKEDFIKLAEIYGIKQSRAANILASYGEKSVQVKDLIERSFLSDGAKEGYNRRYHDRLKAIDSYSVVSCHNMSYRPR